MGRRDDHRGGTCALGGLPDAKIDDVEYEAVGMLGDKEEQILELAHERDCDHIFISGRKRSPTGKALFGDLAQSVLLKFDGTVTIRTD